MCASLLVFSSGCLSNVSESGFERQENQIDVEIGETSATVAPICIFLDNQVVVGSGSLLNIYADDGSVFTGVAFNVHVAGPIVGSDEANVLSISTSRTNLSEPFSKNTYAYISSIDGMVLFPPELNTHNQELAGLEPMWETFNNGLLSTFEMTTTLVKRNSALQMNTYRDENSDSIGCDNGYSPEIQSTDLLPTPFLLLTSADGLTEHLMITYVPEEEQQQQNAVEGASGSPVLSTNSETGKIDLVGIYSAGLDHMFADSLHYILIEKGSVSVIYQFDPETNPEFLVDPNIKTLRGPELLDLLSQYLTSAYGITIATNMGYRGISLFTNSTVDLSEYSTLPEIPKSERSPFSY